MKKNLDQVMQKRSDLTAKLFSDRLETNSALSAAGLHQGPPHKTTSQQSKPLDRTPFTQGSSDAWQTIIVSSILHNASAPLFFMQLKIMRELPLNHSAPILFGIWSLTALINSWVNYYKYILRLTPEFSLTFEDNNIKTKKPGTLYFFFVKKEQKLILHYKILVETQNENTNKQELIEEIVSLESTTLDQRLVDKLAQGKFNTLTKDESVALKNFIKQNYPNHHPVLVADEDFIPGNRKDSWFFTKCAMSEFPSIFSGMILGYTVTVGQSESSRVAAAIFLGLMNYIKNLLIDMPIIVNAYGTNKSLGNLGLIIDQPGTWLVFNTLVIGLLKNVAPTVIAILTAYSILTAKNIPFTVNLIASMMLYPFVASTFLIFTMYALQKLNLNKSSKQEPISLWKHRPNFKTLGEYFGIIVSESNYTIFSIPMWRSLFSHNSVASMLTLHNSFAKETSSWCDILLAAPGEILGWRALTISGFLTVFALSPHFIATLLATMNAIGNIAIIYDPTAEVATSFLKFFFENKADSFISLLTYIMLSLEIFAAIMGAKSQYSNFLEAVKCRADELWINTNTASEHQNPVIRFAEKNNQDNNFAGPYVLLRNQVINMNAEYFRENSQMHSIENESRSYQQLIINYSILYGDEHRDTELAETKDDFCLSPS